MSKAEKTIIKINKLKIKSNDFFSIETKQTQEENSLDEEKLKVKKIKRVSFNGVQIIEVESYKKYNQEGQLIFESLDKNCLDECNCSIF